MDDLCCARAIVTAIARVENHPKWDNIRRGTQLQRSIAVDLNNKAEVALKQCGIEEVKNFQIVLPM